jgi:trk system potassium uptake protein TrkA
VFSVKIVIVGAGNVGYSLAQTLSTAGHDIVVIESREEYAHQLENELDVQVVFGNGSRPSVLAEAGVTEKSSVDFLIACSNRDEVNIMACWQAKHLGVKRVISRAMSVEYTDTPEWAQALHIDEILSPERSVARELEEMIWVNSAVHTTEFLSGQAGSYAFRVTDDSIIKGKSLASLASEFPDFSAVFIFVERDGTGFTPSGDWVAEKGDLCYLITFRRKSKEIEKLFTSQNTKRIRRIMIAGGGKSGMAVTRRLLKKHPGVEIKIIDPDYATCQQIAIEFPDIIVLHGDALDDKLLTHEGISSMDGFIGATGSDERNLILASLANTLQSKKSIAIVRRSSLSRLAVNLPVDAVVNPNESLASVILRYVRYPESAGSLSLIDRINSEILEVVVPEGCPITGKPIHSLNLPKGLIFAMIKRRGEILLPRGNTEIHEGDILLIFSSQESMEKITDLMGISI